MGTIRCCLKNLSAQASILSMHLCSKPFLYDNTWPFNNPPCLHYMYMEKVLHIIQGHHAHTLDHLQFTLELWSAQEIFRKLESHDEVTWTFHAQLYMSIHYCYKIIAPQSDQNDEKSCRLILLSSVRQDLGTWEYIFHIKLCRPYSWSCIHLYVIINICSGSVFEKLVMQNTPAWLAS